MTKRHRWCRKKPINKCSCYYQIISSIIGLSEFWHALSSVASSWENVSSGVSDQVRLKLACSATEASMRLGILVTETRDITLSRQRTTKALIRLRGCAGWSAPLLFAYDIRHVFSWSGSNDFRITRSHKSCIQWRRHALPYNPRLTCVFYM